MPAAFTISAHFWVSEITNWRNSSGVLLSGSMPAFNSASCTALSASAAVSAAFAATIAERAALNPIVCGLIVTIVVDAVILYPIQTATNLLAYETGYYSAADVRRLGIGMLMLTVAVILLTIPYWSVLSLPLTLR